METKFTEPRWYAVYTRPRWEKKVAALLTNKKIENYCPLNKIVRQWSDRKKVVFEPLFTNYIFVRATSDELSEIRKVNGIINFVYWLSKPAVIRDEEIQSIKLFLTDYYDVQLLKMKFGVDDLVRITTGPLTNLEGKVIAIKSQTVKISLPSLGYILHAEVEKMNVKIITRDSQKQNTFQSFD